MKKIIMIAFLAGLLAASCNRKNDVDVKPDLPANKRIARIVDTYQDNTKETQTFTYDVKGRPAVYITDGEKDIFNFQSSSKLVVTAYSLPNNALKSTITCTLNDKGAITQMVFKNPSDVITNTNQYTYNADGYLTYAKFVHPYGWYDIVPEIKDGNYISAKQTFDNGTVYNIQHTYGSAANTLFKSFWGLWEVEGLFGKPSKNLSLESKTVKSNGDLNRHNKVNYTIGADGTVSKYTSTNVLTGTSSLTEITYE